MSYRLEASGARRIYSTASDDDGQVSPAIIPSDSSVVLEAYESQGPIQLTTDAPVSVPFGPAVGSQVHYICLRVKGGRVFASLTSAQGVAIVPVEPRIEIRSDNDPFTALTLQRQVGVEVSVDVYLGRRST